MEEFADYVSKTLTEMQTSLFEKALNFRDQNTIFVDSLQKFEDMFSSGVHSVASSGFVLCRWHPKAIGHKLLDELKVTPRCIPFDFSHPSMPSELEGECIFTGEKTDKIVIFAKAY